MVGPLSESKISGAAFFIGKWAKDRSRQKYIVKTFWKRG